MSLTPFFISFKTPVVPRGPSICVEGAAEKKTKTLVEQEVNEEICAVKLERSAVTLSLNQEDETKPGE